MTHPIAEIFSQGEELVKGQITDTNAVWLSQRLAQMGFEIKRQTTVGDCLQDLVALLQEISSRADFCICTGGLGPTIDDLTTESVALAFERPLQFDSVALAQIERYFLHRNRAMVDANRKQAYFPKGAVRLDNTWGTAPGFTLQTQRCWFAFVPGVPTEMRHLFNAYIQAELEKRFILQADKVMIIKTLGIGESELQQILNEYSLPDAVKLSFRAAVDEVQTKLLFPAETADSVIKNCVNELAKIIGSAVFAIDESQQTSSDLISVINQLMLKNKYTLSVLETVSQGLISVKCMGKIWLQDSSYQQSIDTLAIDLGCNKQSDLVQTAIGFAKKIQHKYHSDLILVQLYEGEKEQIYNQEQNIILYNILLTANGVHHQTATITGSSKQKQNRAALEALNLLRKYLQQCL